MLRLVRCLLAFREVPLTAKLAFARQTLSVGVDMRGKPRRDNLWRCSKTQTKAFKNGARIYIIDTTGGVTLLRSFTATGTLSNRLGTFPPSFLHSLPQGA